MVKNIITIILGIIVFVFIIYLRNYIFSYKSKSSNLKRFRNKLTSRNHKHQRIFDNHSESLASNPNENIRLADWESEDDIIEKANIHKARLSKFGKSRLNGKIFYLDKEGSIFTIGNNGNRDYL